MPDLNQPIPFPFQSGTSAETAGISTATTNGTLLTAHADADTKGVWVELLAATTKKTVWIIAAASYAALGPFRVDVGIGAASSEVVIIPDIIVTTQEMQRVTPIFMGSVTVAAGTRLSARCQCATGGNTIYFGLLLVEVD